MKKPGFDRATYQSLAKRFALAGWSTSADIVSEDGMRFEPTERGLAFFNEFAKLANFWRNPENGFWRRILTRLRFEARIVRTILRIQGGRRFTRLECIYWRNQVMGFCAKHAHGDDEVQESKD